MSIKRIAIKNRHDLKLVIQVDEPENPTNLVFIAHGQGGFIEQPHIQAFADAFLENDFRVVRFDATNSIGESDGDIINVTTTNYLEDLQDVIKWARTQQWYKEPFALAGHSMGGMSTALYAEQHPKEVLCLAPIAAVINYHLAESKYDPKDLKSWQKQGYQESKSYSKPGVVKRVRWGFMEDLKKYDLLRNASRLAMPVLLMAGEDDKGTPYKHQKILYDAMPGNKVTLLKVENADHNFRGSGDYAKKLREVKKAISEWLRNNRLSP
jgi:pimeloyl-ACP methyl ester carboxylesterase